MLQNILVIIEMTLRKKMDDTVKINKILNFLKHYKKGMYLYPGVLIRKFGIDINTAFFILNDLEKQRILKSSYELHHCGQVMGYVEVFNKLPETFECNICDEEVPALDNSSLIYEVIKDE